MITAVLRSVGLPPCRYERLLVSRRVRSVIFSVLMYVVGAASITAAPLQNQWFSSTWTSADTDPSAVSSRQQAAPPITNNYRFIQYQSENHNRLKRGFTVSKLQTSKDGQNFSPMKNGSCNNSDTVRLGELSAHVISRDLLERNVPKLVSRFDYPWSIPRRWKLLTLQQSRNRVLYSPVRDKSGAGLGHAMATVNADISAAIRLNLTYTHRIPMCGALSRPLKDNIDIDNMTRIFHHAGAVEQLFGWGVGEIPREHVQAAVNISLIYETNNSACRIIDNKQLSAQKREIGRLRRHNSTGHTRFTLRVDRVIEIPPQLAYHYPHFPTKAHKRRLEIFLRSHPEPYTAFSMPSEYCNKIPAYGVESLQQRSIFFHKYWDAHGYGAPEQPKNKKLANETFSEYRKRVTNSRSLGHVGRRPRLNRLMEDAVNIAVHARRGDFFDVNRPMLPMKSIANVIRQIIGKVVSKRKSVFSKMKVSVAIYSEGLTLHSNRTSSDHEVEKMRHEFLDVDRSVLDEVAIRKMLIGGNSSKKNVFKNGLQISLRISEDTVLCVHEMIAADVFIGSESGLSTHVVGSTSRAAFIMTPARHSKATGRFAVFDRQSGKVEKTEIQIMQYFWDRFVKHNEASAHRAVLSQHLR